MIDHPGRVIIFAILCLVTLVSSGYARSLKAAYDHLRKEADPDEAAVQIARDRLGMIGWLIAAQCSFMLWGFMIISIDSPINWRIIVTFFSVFSGQLLIAWAIHYRINADDKFDRKYADRARFYCTDFECPYRADRQTQYRQVYAPWRKGKDSTIT